MLHVEVALLLIQVKEKGNRFVQEFRKERLPFLQKHCPQPYQTILQEIDCIPTPVTAATPVGVSLKMTAAAHRDIEVVK